MGPGIVIPLVIVLVGVPVAFGWAKRRFKDGVGESSDEPRSAPSTLLTSNALRALPTPRWRVVYEIPDTRLGGVEHVLIGPPGVFALRTSMDPLPPAVEEPVDPRVVAQVAVARGGLDDALRRCGMGSDRLVEVHWGASGAGRPAAVEVFRGLTAVDGRRLAEWAATLDGNLGQAQVDLAWQTVTTAIGRPDPLA